jgi:hypothetical protein
MWSHGSAYSSPSCQGSSQVQLAVTVGKRGKDTIQSQHAQSPLRCLLPPTIYVWRPEVNHKRDITRSAMAELLRYLHQYTRA